MRKLLLPLILLTLPVLDLSAGNDGESTFGGWFFTEVNHDFKNLYVTEYLEHDNLEYSRTEGWFSRTSVGVKVLPWLKVGVNYTPSFSPGNATRHFGEVDVVGTLKSGDLKVSIRERYRHCFTGASCNELRSRFKVAYSVPDTKMGFYLAPEVFTWGDRWMKTRHYVGWTYDLKDWMQLETYYIYYAFKNTPAEHVIGIGLNFNI